MRQTKIILFLLTIFTADIQSQTDIIFKENFVVFKGDTFNRQDKGNLSGKGLAIYSDTAFVTSTRHLQKDTSWKNIKYYPVGVGQYKDNKKQGDWYYSSTKDLDKLDAKISYVDNEIKEVLCFKDSNRKKVWLKAKWVDSKLQFYWLDPKTGKFVKKKDSLNLLREIYYVQ